MQPSDRQKFGEGMQVLRRCYPSDRVTDEDFAGRLDAYFAQLFALPWACVMTALQRAAQPEFYPDWFPTSGQLARVAQTARLEIEDTARVRHAEQSSVARDKQLWEEFYLIPEEPERQAIYIADADGPYEKLAREWECESRTGGYDPTKKSPPGVGERRVAELLALMKHSGMRSIDEAIGPRQVAAPAEKTTAGMGSEAEIPPTGSEPAALSEDVPW